MRQVDGTSHVQGTLVLLPPPGHYPCPCKCAATLSGSNCPAGLIPVEHHTLACTFALESTAGVGPGAVTITVGQFCSNSPLQSLFVIKRCPKLPRNGAN